MCGTTAQPTGPRPAGAQRSAGRQNLRCATQSAAHAACLLCVPSPPRAPGAALFTFAFPARCCSYRPQAVGQAAVSLQPGQCKQHSMPLRCTGGWLAGPGWAYCMQRPCCHARTVASRFKPPCRRAALPRARDGHCRLGEHMGGVWLCSCTTATARCLPGLALGPLEGTSSEALSLAGGHLQPPALLAKGGGLPFICGAPQLVSRVTACMPAAAPAAHGLLCRCQGRAGGLPEPRAAASTTADLGPRSARLPAAHRQGPLYLGPLQLQRVPAVRG